MTEIVVKIGTWFLDAYKNPSLVEVRLELLCCMNRIMFIGIIYVFVKS